MKNSNLAATTALLMGLLLSGCCLLMPEPTVTATVFGQIKGASPCGRMPPPGHPGRAGCQPQPVPNTLRFIAESDGSQQVIETDAAGRYSIELPAGEYRLQVPAKGLYLGAERTLSLTAGQQYKQNLQLRSKAR